MGNNLKKLKKFAVLLAAAAALGCAPAAAAPTELIPGGMAVGIELATKGVLVTALGEVRTALGTENPARDAGLLPGDLLTEAGGVEILGMDDFRGVMRNCTGEKLSLRVERAGRTLMLSARPAAGENGEYRLGLWLRDGISGIGTVTYLDPLSGSFGMLGHAVSDAETGVRLPLRSGEIAPTVITGVVRGEKGSPGQLQGGAPCGSTAGRLEKNCSEGLFGVAEGGALLKNRPLPVGEPETGGAVIMCDVGCGVKEYTIKIEKVYRGSENRSMLISVTDDELKEKCGGIVQGMSGSPIIQSGKIVGAVTHVLINDPARGYGISINRMLSAAFAEERAA